MSLVMNGVGSSSLGVLVDDGIARSRRSPSGRTAGRPPFAPGTDVVATDDFHGVASMELPFRKNDRLRIVGATKDPNWYMARCHTGEQGMIPAEYVRLPPHLFVEHDRPKSVSPISPGTRAIRAVVADTNGHASPGQQSMPWFHSQLSRDDTERLLSNKADGTFLVRESTNFPGDYTLCMAYKKKVEHYRIFQKRGKFTCDDEGYFDSLTQLVSHYKRDADGLCYRLISPLISSEYMSTMGKDEPDIAERAKIFKNEGLVIRRHELKLGDTIGHGEFGDVLVGNYKERKVAVKVLKRNGVVDALLQEAQLIAGLRHRNLVQLVGVVLDDIHELYMVTEFMANGNLVDYLRSRGRHQVERARLIGFAVDICEGMAYLESQQIVHRDLAARNILLAEDLTAKISDFGLAINLQQANDRSVETAGKFPIKWTAPEALRYGDFSCKSDMWSFGVLLWEIYSFGRVPYPRIPIQDVVRHIEKGYRMEPPEGCPTEISKLMHEAWAFKGVDRPKFHEMCVKLRAIAAAASPPRPASPILSAPDAPAHNLTAVVTTALTNSQ